MNDEAVLVELASAHRSLVEILGVLAKDIPEGHPFESRLLRADEEILEAHAWLRERANSRKEDIAWKVAEDDQEN